LAAGNNLKFLDFSDGRTLVAAAGFLSEGIHIVACDMDADHSVGCEENIRDQRTCSKEDKLLIDLRRVLAST